MTRVARNGASVPRPLGGQEQLEGGQVGARSLVGLHADVLPQLARVLVDVLAHLVPAQRQRMSARARRMRARQAGRSCGPACMRVPGSSRSACTAGRRTRRRGRCAAAWPSGPWRPRTPSRWRRARRATRPWRPRAAPPAAPAPLPAAEPAGLPQGALRVSARRQGTASPGSQGSSLRASAQCRGRRAPECGCACGRRLCLREGRADLGGELAGARVQLLHGQAAGHPLQLCARIGSPLRPGSWTVAGGRTAQAPLCIESAPFCFLLASSLAALSSSCSAALLCCRASSSWQAQAAGARQQWMPPCRREPKKAQTRCAPPWRAPPRRAAAAGTAWPCQTLCT